MQCQCIVFMEVESPFFAFCLTPRSDLFGLTLSLQMVGAFGGAVAVWLHWIPHFKTVPEPPAPSSADNLLRKRDALPKNAIEISSYSPHSPWLMQGLRMRRKKAPPPPPKLPRITSDVSLHGAEEGEAASALLPQPAAVGQRLRGATRDFRGVINDWISNFRYYLVNRDEFAMPEVPLQPATLTPAPTPAAPAGSQQVEGSGIKLKPSGTANFGNL